MGERETSTCPTVHDLVSMCIISLSTKDVFCPTVGFDQHGVRQDGGTRSTRRLDNGTHKSFYICFLPSAMGARGCGGCATLLVARIKERQAEMAREGVRRAARPSTAAHPAPNDTVNALQTRVSGPCHDFLLSTSGIIHMSAWGGEAAPVVGVALEGKSGGRSRARKGEEEAAKRCPLLLSILLFECHQG